MSELPIEREPFQRRTDEPSADYEIFTEWCRVPPSSRTIENLSRRTGIPALKISQLHKKWNWDPRALAYDEAALALRPDPRSMDEEASIAGQLYASKALLELGLTALQLKDPSRIGVGKAMELVQAALKAQRAALGEADVNVNVTSTDLSRVNELLLEIGIEDAEIVEEETEDAEP